MKITIYTVETCKFSAEEKEYLKSKNLPFEEKDVEKDHAALEQMLKVGNNFAGTPVTEIVFDDADEAKNPQAAPAEGDAPKSEYKDEVKTGRLVVLKGFTKEEFEKELFPPAEEAKPAEGEKADDGTDKPVDPNAPPVSVAPATVPGAPAPNPLDSILQDLQSKIPPPTLDNPPAGPPQAPPAPPVPAEPVDPTAPAAPSLPNFPGQQQ